MLSLMKHPPLLHQSIANVAVEQVYLSIEEKEINLNEYWNTATAVVTLQEQQRDDDRRVEHKTVVPHHIKPGHTKNGPPSKLPQPKIKGRNSISPVRDASTGIKAKDTSVRDIDHISITPLVNSKKESKKNESLEVFLTEANNVTTEASQSRDSDINSFDHKVSYNNSEAKRASSFVNKLKRDQEERERRRRLLLESEGEIMKQEALLAEQKRKLIAAAAAEERAAQLEERRQRAEAERQERWNRIEALRREEKERARAKKKMGHVPLYKKMEEKFETTVVQTELQERQRALNEIKRMKVQPTREEIVQHEKTFVERLPHYGTDRLDRRKSIELQHEREIRLSKAREQSRQKAALEMERKKHYGLTADEVKRGNKEDIDTDSRGIHRKIVERKTNAKKNNDRVDIKVDTLPSLNEKYSKIFLEKQRGNYGVSQIVKAKEINNITSNEDIQRDVEDNTNIDIYIENSVDEMNKEIDDTEDIEKKRLTDMYVNVMKSKLNYI